jgi:hypothetical protein
MMSSAEALLAGARTIAPTSNKVSEQNADGRESERQSMTSTPSETLAAKKSEHRCLGRVNTDVLELERIKRDEIEVRWGMLGDELLAEASRSALSCVRMALASAGRPKKRRQHDPGFTAGFGLDQSSARVAYDPLSCGCHVPEVTKRKRATGDETHPEYLGATG